MKKALFLGVFGVLLAGCYEEPSSYYVEQKRRELFLECVEHSRAVASCERAASNLSKHLQPPPPARNDPGKVGDMCEQRDQLLEPGLRDKFDAFICIRPKE